MACNQHVVKLMVAKQQQVGRGCQFESNKNGKCGSYNSGKSPKKKV
jgi:hypothetical protein